MAFASQNAISRLKLHTQLLSAALLPASTEAFHALPQHNMDDSLQDIMGRKSASSNSLRAQVCDVLLTGALRP